MKRLLALAVAAIPACGGSPLPQGAKPEPTADVTREASAEPADPWTRQAGALRGIRSATEACVVADVWADAEAWAKAFRMPKDQAPSKGAELPRAELTRVTPKAPPPKGWPARIYRQVVDYPLAGKKVTRRFVMTENAKKRVTGCAVHEVVDATPERDKLEEGRFERLGDRHWELTNAPQPPKGRGVMVQLMTTRSTDVLDGFRHICTVEDGPLSCITMSLATTRELVGPRLGYDAHGGLASVVVGRSGPFLLPFVPGRSVVLGGRSKFGSYDSLNVANLVMGRAMATGAPPESTRDEQPTIDTRKLDRFVDHGACVTVFTDVKPRPAPDSRDEDADDFDDDDDDFDDDEEWLPSISWGTPELWAESFWPRGMEAGRATHIGELVPGYGVESFSLRVIEEHIGGAQFVFVAEPGHVHGCLVQSGRDPYKVVPNSFRLLGKRQFSYALESDAMSLVRDDEEPRIVTCSLDGHRLDCASEPPSGELDARATLKSPRP